MRRHLAALLAFAAFLAAAPVHAEEPSPFGHYAAGGTLAMLGVGLSAGSALCMSLHGPVDSYYGIPQDAQVQTGCIGGMVAAGALAFAGGMAIIVAGGPKTVRPPPPVPVPVVVPVGQSGKVVALSFRF